MLFINRDDEIKRIVDVFTDEVGTIENTVYKLEEVKFANEKEKRFVEGLLNIYNDYNAYVAFDRKVQDYKRTNEVLEKYHSAFEKKINKYIANLNQSYDTFVNEFGAINEQLKQINKWYNGLIPILSALEIEEEITEQTTLFPEVSWKKSDIFSTTYQREEEATVSKFLSPQEAVIKSINYKGYIDQEYIDQLTQQDLGDLSQGELRDLVIYNPVAQQYELRDTYLSGDIYKKIRELQQANIPSESKAFPIQELQRILPKKVPFFKIEKQFGARWIPEELLRRFLNDYFGNYFVLKYDSNNDSFLVKASADSTKFKTYTTRGNGSNKYIKDVDIITNAFYDNYPVVNYTEFRDGKKVTFQDKEAMQFYRREITNLRNSFINFISQIPDEEKTLLENIYNEKFNAIVLPKANGEILDFSDMALSNINVPDVYPHQKNAIWQCLMNGGGVVDHEVGFGKTLTMCGLANKVKALNIAKKPVIIGLKANVQELASTYKKLYPEARVLFSSTKEWDKKNREVFLNKIKNNDWDVIIMGHSQFLKIPQDDKVTKEILERELKDIEDNLFAVKWLDFSKKQLQGLQTRQKNLRKKFSEVQARLEKRKDENVLSFSDLGIDHIIIDESHKFKNLEFQTRHQRVAGLGQTEGGQETSK